MQFSSRSWGTREDYNGLKQPVTTRQVRTLTRTRTGTRLPKWRSIIEAGGNATTSMSAVWDSVEIDPANCTVKSQHGSNANEWSYHKNEGDICLQNDQWTFTPRDPTVDTTFVDNLARAAFYNKLRQINYQFSGMIFAGELRETLHMLLRPAQGIRNLSKEFLDTIRKRKRANPKKWVDDLGNAWLEQAFGWKPLLNDVQDAIKAYNRSFERDRHKLVSAGAAKGYDRSSEVRTSGLGAGDGVTPTINGGCTFQAVTRLYEFHIIRYKAKVTARVEDPPVWRNLRLFGFTPESFVPTAWELLPWSFLADYFTNIGDILNATYAILPTINFVNKTTIRKTIFERKYTLDAVGTAKKAWFGNTGVLLYSEGSGGSLRYIRRRVNRDANSGIAIPSFQFSLGLSDGQLGNIAALLSTARSLHPQNQPRNFHL